MIWNNFGITSSIDIFGPVIITWLNDFRIQIKFECQETKHFLYLPLILKWN